MSESMRARISVRLGRFEPSTAFETGPVFRLEIGGYDAGVEAVEFLDVVFECGGSADGEVAVVGIGTFGRSETFEPHAGDGHVAVTSH